MAETANQKTKHIPHMILPSHISLRLLHIYQPWIAHSLLPSSCQQPQSSLQCSYPKIPCPERIGQVTHVNLVMKYYRYHVEKEYLNETNITDLNEGLKLHFIVDCWVGRDHSQFLWWLRWAKCIIWMNSEKGYLTLLHCHYSSIKPIDNLLCPEREKFIPQGQNKSTNLKTYHGLKNCIIITIISLELEEILSFTMTLLQKHCSILQFSYQFYCQIPIKRTCQISCKFRVIDDFTTEMIQLLLTFDNSSFIWTFVSLSFL